MSERPSRLRLFLTELKRRKVIQVAISYAAVAFIVVQVASIFFPALHLPPWTVTFVVAIAILGFPVALLLSWAFDLTRDSAGWSLPSAPGATGIEETAHDRQEDESETGSTAAKARSAAAQALPSDLLQPAGVNNLPHQPTPFIGREEELDEIGELLEEPSCRLLTICGTGGIGKTRLALEAAERHRHAFAHGVCFLPLSRLSSADPLIPTVAEHLELALSSGEDSKLQLLNYLREKQLLLVTDNFEHLAEGSGLLKEILDAAPGVKIIVTSRERLSLHGETLFPLQGLSFPQAEDTDRIEGFESIQLFLQIATRVNPHYSLSEEEIPPVVRICRLVEGIPLAIELAAAWVRVLSGGEIEQQIRTDHDFLSGSLRDVPERHRSLRAVFESAWRLLSHEERRAFRRLAVFRGGFSREAVIRVAGASVPLLMALLDKSLLRKAPSGRFEVLEVLRQYAEEKLDQDPDEQAGVRNRHCEYYTGLLRALREPLEGAEEKDALDQIGEEIENVRAAWRWAIAQQKIDEVAESLESLFSFYDARGWAREGEEVFAGAVSALQQSDQPGDAKAAVLAKLLARAGVFSYRLGRHENAEELLQRALATFRELQDRAEIAFSLDKLGLITNVTGEYLQAKQLHEESLAIYRDLDDRRGAGRSLTHLGNIAYALGEYAEAKRLYRESLVILRAMGDRRGMATVLQNLGIIAAIEESYSEANQLLQESRAIAREWNDQRRIANSLQIQGHTAFLAGVYAEAEGYLLEAVSICQNMGFRGLLPYCLNALANVANAQAEPRRARELYHQALATAAEIHVIPLMLEILIGIARLLGQEEESERAAELLSLVLHHPAGDQAAKDSARHLLAELEVGLSPPAVERALESGQSLQLEAVVAEILASRKTVVPT